MSLTGTTRTSRVVRQINQGDDYDSEKITNVNMESSFKNKGNALFVSNRKKHYQTLNSTVTTNFT